MAQWRQCCCPRCRVSASSNAQVPRCRRLTAAPPVSSSRYEVKLKRVFDRRLSLAIGLRRGPQRCTEGLLSVRRE
jgi:hypothetical protein